MFSYRFDFRLDGAVLHSAEHQFDDDLDALDEAARLSEDFEIEIVSGERFVARVKKGDEPLSARDAKSI
jgi:hypothetical protein